MNFDIKDNNGKSLNLTFSTVTNNGNVLGNNKLWYTLSGSVQQNGGDVLYAVYPCASWSNDGENYHKVGKITVNPLASGDVDIYID